MLRPLFPLMRLLVLPLHEDVAALYRSVDAANAKTDKFVASIQLLHLLDHNLVVELTKLRLEHEALKSRLRLAEKDLEMLTKRERAVEERVFPE
jgi:regulator of replication initiation timing